MLGDQVPRTGGARGDQPQWSVHPESAGPGGMDQGARQPMFSASSPGKLAAGRATEGRARCAPASQRCGCGRSARPSRNRRAKKIDVTRWTVRQWGKSVPRPGACRRCAGEYLRTVGEVGHVRRGRTRTRPCCTRPGSGPPAANRLDFPLHSAYQAGEQPLATSRLDAVQARKVAPKRSQRL